MTEKPKISKNVTEFDFSSSEIANSINKKTAASFAFTSRRFNRSNHMLQREKLHLLVLFDIAFLV